MMYGFTIPKEDAMDNLGILRRTPGFIGLHDQRYPKTLVLFDESVTANTIMNIMKDNGIDILNPVAIYNNISLYAR